MAPDVQLWLLVAAADSTGNVDLIMRAADHLGLSDQAADEAEQCRSDRARPRRHVPASAGAVRGLQRRLGRGPQTGPRRPLPGGDRAGSDGARGLACRQGHGRHRPGRRRSSRTGRRPRRSTRRVRLPRQGAGSGRRTHSARCAAQRAPDRGRRGGAGGRCCPDRAQPHRQRRRRHRWTRCNSAARPRSRPRWPSSPPTRAELVWGAANMLDAAAAVHGIDPRLEQTALIRAFEYCLPSERLTQGVTLPELGARLRDGAEVADGPAATILRGLSAHILLPYAEAVPIMREPSTRSLQLEDGDELLRLGAVSVALTTALWDHARPSRLPAASRRDRPGRRIAAAAGHHAVDPVAGRADRRDAPAGGGVHRAGAGAPTGDRLRGRARGERRLPGLDRCPARPGRGARRGDAADRFRRCPLLGRRRPRPARPRRGPLPRCLPPAQAADRRPVPSGHPACSTRTSSKPRCGVATQGGPGSWSRPSPRWRTPTGRRGRTAWPSGPAR